MQFAASAAGILVLAAVAAPAAAQQPVPQDWHLVQTLRRSSVHPDDDAGGWAAGFFGVELHSPTGDLRRADAAAAREALNGFAAGGGVTQLAATLHTLRDRQLTLALAALGDALFQTYDADALEANVTFAGSLGAAQAWLSGEAGPSAGTCGAIHDTLRRVARLAGHQEAVTLNIPGSDAYGHVIAAWRSESGWTALDYNRWLDSPTTSFGEFLEMAVTARGRIGGEVQVFRDGYLYTHETRAGRLAGRFFDRPGVAGLGASLFDGVPLSGTGGVRARYEPGLMAVDGDWVLGDTGGRVTTAIGMLDDSNPLLSAGVAWTAGGNWWHAATRWQAGAVAGTELDGDGGAALIVSHGVAGVRVDSAVGRLGLGLVYDLFHDLGALARLASGRGSNPFRSLAQGGLTAGWTAEAWDTVTFSARTTALAEAALSDVRRQQPGVFASQWRSEAAVEMTHGRLHGAWTWERTGATIEAGAAVRAAGVELTARAARTQARRPELEPSSAAIEGGIAWRPGPFAITLTAGWTTTTGAHGHGGRFDGRAELSYRW